MVTNCENIGTLCPSAKRSSRRTIFPLGARTDQPLIHDQPEGVVQR
jgi:hypothetical protein